MARRFFHHGRGGGGGRIFSQQLLLQRTGVTPMRIGTCRSAQARTPPRPPARADVAGLRRRRRPGRQGGQARRLVEVDVGNQRDRAQSCGWPPGQRQPADRGRAAPISQPASANWRICARVAPHCGCRCWSSTAPTPARRRRRHGTTRIWRVIPDMTPRTGPTPLMTGVNERKRGKVKPLELACTEFGRISPVR